MSDKRTGKRVKFERSRSCRTTDLDELFNVVYHAKVAEGISDTTLNMYKDNYRFFCDYLDLKQIPRDVTRITPEVCREYTTWLLKEKIRFDGHEHKSDAEKTVGLSPVSVNTRTKNLRAMFRFLKAESLINFNPWENVAKVEEPDTKIQILSVEQIKRLFDMPDQRRYAGFRDYVLMNFLLDSMCRIGEGTSLKKTDVDFTLCLVNIRAEIAKNRTARTIPIEKRTLNLIKELMAECEEFDSEYIFLTNYGGRLSENHYRHRLKEYTEQAGLNVNVHPHLFRHSAATLFLEKGGELRHLAKMLGHRDLRTVMKYTHLSNKSLINQHRQYSPINDVIGALNRERKVLR